MPNITTNHAITYTNNQCLAVYYSVTLGGHWNISHGVQRSSDPP